MPYQPAVPLPRGWSCEEAAEAFMIDEQTMRLLGVTTVGRILKETEPIPEETATLDVIEADAGRSCLSS